MNVTVKPGANAYETMSRSKSCADTSNCAEGALASNAIIIIKPEELDDNRESSIIAFISEYCKRNCLDINISKMRFTGEMLERHYLRGARYACEIGEKLTCALRDAGKKIKSRAVALTAKDMIKAHRDSYVGKDFILIKITGPGALAKINMIKGCTDPTKAAPDTIRGRFCTGMSVLEAIEQRKPLRNIVHISRDAEELRYDAQTYGVKLSTLFPDSEFKAY